MILLIDTAGNRERALAALLAQGIEPVEVLEREDLQLRHPLATWQRLRRVHPGRCYIFCRLIEAQFNRFPLKVLGALTGARTIHFCDERKLGPGMTPARILSRDFLLYLWHCAGALLAAFAFFVAYIALRLMVRSRKPALPQRSSAKRLCYIKTDFWRDLKAGGSVTHTREFINAGCALGYEIDVFACDPLVEYPSAVALGPRPGSVFVAVDYMTGLGTEIIRRDEIRLLEDTDGDGYADKATVYATVKVSPSGAGTFIGFGKNSTTRAQAYANAIIQYLRNVQFDKSNDESTVTVQFNFNVQ